MSLRRGCTSQPWSPRIAHGLPTRSPGQPRQEMGSLFDRWRTGGPERGQDLPKVTEQSEAVWKG